jgi:hypothetical protein
VFKVEIAQWLNPCPVIPKFRVRVQLLPMSTGCLYYKTFYGCNCGCIIISQSICHFHPSQIFVGKARSLPLEWCLVRGYTMENSRRTTSIYFYPSLILVGKARSLPLEWSLVRGYTLVSSSHNTFIRFHPGASSTKLFPTVNAAIL